MKNLSWSVWGTPKDKIIEDLSEILDETPVVLCLGSDRLLQDCLGPMVGSALVEQRYPSYVYGTLDAPICCQNLESAYKFIKATHPHKKLLVIDASSTRQAERLGRIVLARDYQPLNPKLKNIQLSADWFLFGVCSMYSNTFPQIVGARLAIIQKLSETISEVLLSTIAQVKVSASLENNFKQFAFI